MQKAHSNTAPTHVNSNANTGTEAGIHHSKTKIDVNL
jgi:hypothetical protein